MAYDFPANPTVGQEFIPPVGGQTYIWQPPRWLVKGVPPAGGGGGGGITEAPIDTKQYARQDAAWSEVVANPTWTTLTGKPATFPPTLPIAQSDVTGLVTALAAKEPSLPAGGTTSNYLRGDKTWVVPPAPGISDATSDGQTYGRSNAAWVADTWRTTTTLSIITDKNGSPKTSRFELDGNLTLAAATPSSGTHAANKTYVDTQDATKAALSHTHTIAQVTSLQTSLDAKLNLAGGTMLGELLLWGNPTVPLSAAPKQYVDTQDATKIGDAPNDANAYVRSALAWVVGYTKAAIDTLLNAKAPLASPAFTGTVTAPAVTVAGAVNSNTLVTSGGAIVGGDLTVSGLTTTGTFNVTGSATALTRPAGDNGTSIATTAFVKAAVDTGDALKVAKAGDTMTGDLTIRKASPGVILDKTSGGSTLQGKLNGVNRWTMYFGGGETESGGNTGSHLSIYRHDDAGVSIPPGPVVLINRTTGITTLDQLVVTTGPITVGGLPFVGGASIADTPPAGAVNGQLWWESDSGNLFIFVVDAGGGAGQWVQVNITAVAEVPNGGIIASATAVYSTNVAITTVIPVDDTVPLVSEGTEILSVVITPKAAANMLRCRFSGFGSTSTAPLSIVAAMFKDGVCVDAAVSGITTANYAQALTMEGDFPAAGTVPVTISVRVGPGVAGTMRMNGSGAGRYFGGGANCTLVVEEIKT